MRDTNTVVVNQGLDPMLNCHFMLRVEGVYDVPCRKIYSFAREYKYEYIQEGGLNDYVHRRRKPADAPYTFRVERYAGTDYFDPLPNGADLMLPVILFVSRHADDFLASQRVYLFTGCTVTAKEYGQLDAEQSSLLTETATIAYHEMLCLDLKTDGSKTTWAFEQHNTAGNGQRSAAVNRDEMSRVEMEKEAEKRDKQKAGNRQKSSKTGYS